MQWTDRISRSACVAPSSLEHTKISTRACREGPHFSSLADARSPNNAWSASEASCAPKHVFPLAGPWGRRMALSLFLSTRSHPSPLPILVFLFPLWWALSRARPSGHRPPYPRHTSLHVTKLCVAPGEWSARAGRPVWGPPGPCVRIGQQGISCLGGTKRTWGVAGPGHWLPPPSVVMSSTTTRAPFNESVPGRVAFSPRVYTHGLTPFPPPHILHRSCRSSAFPCVLRRCPSSLRSRRPFPAHPARKRAEPVPVSPRPPAYDQ